MSVRNVATKTNLMKLSRELEFARLGYELLDQKRNILVLPPEEPVARARISVSGQQNAVPVFSGEDGTFEFTGATETERRPVRQLLTDSWRYQARTRHGRAPSMNRRAEERGKGPHPGTRSTSPSSSGRRNHTPCKTSERGSPRR